MRGKITEGTSITGIKVFAGYGTSTELRVRHNLTVNYGGDRVNGNIRVEWLILTAKGNPRQALRVKKVKFTVNHKKVKSTGLKNR